MQCKCGKELKHSLHSVTTERGKKIWIDECPVGNIIVEQWDCPVCERHQHKVWYENKVIKKFG